MPDALKIALGQLNQSVGDLGANADGILAARREAQGADLIVFPELHLIGYPPEDLVLKPSLVEKAAARLDELALASASDGPAMLVGSAFVRDGALHNGVALLDQGRVSAVRFKHELPNYGTFDEKRLFQPGPLPEPVILRGTMLGVPICEDIWRPEVCRHLADFGAEMFICINGSPYEINKEALRIEGVAKRRAIDTGIPLAYLNRVGGQDELVFDGASFVVNADGSLAVQGRDWEEQILETRWTRTAQGWRCDRGVIIDAADYPENIYSAIVLALRDFVERGGFEGILLDLSEQAASALSAAIAVDALGPERVHGVLFLSGSHGGAEAKEARRIAQELHISCQEIAIDRLLAQAVDTFALVQDPAGAELSGVLQPRLRASALKTLAEARVRLLLSSVTKTGLSLGGAVMGGQVAGDFAPLKDVYASTGQALLKWRTGASPVIGTGPERGVDLACLTPAFLAPDLPHIAVLDAMLFGLVDQDKSIDQLVAEGLDRATLRRVETYLHQAERIRRQAPPGVKLTPRSFGRDRRYPVTHAFRTG